MNSAGASLEWPMGSSTDAAKLGSSTTLFGQVAKELSESCRNQQAFAEPADEVLTAAAAQGYQRCRHTLDRLGTE